VDSAVQKAYIKVDEKGATAAAVTALAMAGTGMPQPTEPFEMKCDKPFVFVLTGNSGDVLFTGVVNQP
jgi:serpin B